MRERKGKREKEGIKGREWEREMQFFIPRA